jgi:hypothetical protein
MKREAGMQDKKTGVHEKRGRDARKLKGGDDN